MTITTDRPAAFHAALSASPAATLPREQITIHTFAKDEHGYFLVPPSIHLRAARARGWVFAIRVASVLGHHQDAWSAAMTALYGTTGLHATWCDAAGLPTPEALEKLPGLRFAMEDAARRWDRYVEQVERRERTESGPYARWWAAAGLQWQAS